MIRTVLLAALALVLISAVQCLAATARKKLLVVTHTAGFRHTEGIEAGDKVIPMLAERSGKFTVDFCRTADDVKLMLTPEYLKSYDGVIFNNTTGNLGIPDLQAFLGWLKTGKAFVGIHSATDTYHPESIGGDRSYIDMVGAQFRTHGKQCQVECIVEDPAHPAVKHLGKTWKVFDEIYLFKENRRQHVHVLLALDRHPDDGSAEANQPGDYLVSWCSRYGAGRVFYTSLGHRADVWEDAAYQKHLLGGILWALGLEKGAATPGGARTRTAK